MCSTYLVVCSKCLLALSITIFALFFSRVVLTQLQGSQKIQAYHTPWKGGHQSYLTKKTLITITPIKQL